MEPKDSATQPDARAQHRAFVLEHVINGGLTIEQAAAILTLSTRQVGRLLARSADGQSGLAHGNRGQTPANRLDDVLRARLIELATTTYDGVNRAHLAELLAEREGLVVAPRTLRRILAEAAVEPVRTRRSPRHRSRRERMPQEGMLLQVDGSRHRWFGPELPFATLVAGIDDATSRVSGGTFRAAEDAVGYFATFAQTADRYGLPGATYSDRHGIFIVERNRPPTLAEQLTGKRSFTQVGRALEEAGIGWIGAHSAEAKGRVERLWPRCSPSTAATASARARQPGVLHRLVTTLDLVVPDGVASPRLRDLRHYPDNPIIPTGARLGGPPERATAREGLAEAG